MKTAIYIEDKVVQLVITPETEFEKNALTSFSDSPLKAQIFTGTFYDCRGGWTRQSDRQDRAIYPDHSEDKSLIIRINTEKKGEAKDC